MSDQQPAYTPPPVSPPPPSPGPYGQPAYSPAGGPPQPPKRRTGLIIAIVVGVLLLCCCLSAVAGLLLFRTTEQSGGDVSIESDSQSTIGTETNSDDSARLQEWLDWAPDSPPMLDPAPASLDAYIAESMSIIAPEFELEDAVLLPGEYVEEDDWYYADAVYTRATHPSASDVSAAVEMWIQTDQMIDEEVDFEPEEGDVVTTIDNGSRQLLYIAQWGPAGFGLEGDEELALWKQIGRDWPDALVTDGTEQGDQFQVSITKWEAYAIDGDYPIVSVTYAQEDGEWVIVDWEYEYPDQAYRSAT